MSHFSKMKTAIRDLTILERACENLGIKLTVGDNLRIRGYEGDLSQAEAKIEGKHYDIGFVKKDETYEVVADQWGLASYEHMDPTKYFGKLFQEYAAEGTRQWASLNNYSVSETAEKDEIVMKLESN